MFATNTEKKHSRVILNRITETLDHETGVVQTESEERTVRFNAEPPYVKMYIDDLCSVVNAPNSLKDVLLMSLRKLDYEGYMSLSTRYRKQICIDLGIKDGTLRNRLSQLVKRGFMVSVGGNEYLANPNLFARGEWKNIIEQRKAFEMKIRYLPNGEKTLVTEILSLDESA